MVDAGDAYEVIFHKEKENGKWRKARIRWMVAVGDTAHHHQSGVEARLASGDSLTDVQRDDLAAQAAALRVQINQMEN